MPDERIYCEDEEAAWLARPDYPATQDSMASLNGVSELD